MATGRCRSSEVYLKFLFLAALLSFYSCASVKQNDEPIKNGQVSTEGKVSIHYVLQNFPKAESERMGRLFKVAEKVINSEEFRTRVYGAYYDKKREFVQNNGLTNEQIYQKAIEGAESNGPIDYIWRMDITYERGGRGVLGWTYPSVSRIWFNSRYFKYREDSGIVGTICHEQLHKLGFTHDSNSTKRRPYSVPYSIGTVCAEIAEKLL